MGYSSIQNRDIFTDLLREFINQGHRVYVVSPAERRLGTDTGLINEDNSTILRVKTGNIQKTSIVEKGISTVLLEQQFIAAIKKYFDNIKFQLVLYGTPPITLKKAVDYIKKRDNAATYLMLKDIFPQNAVDIGMLTTSGVKGLLYRAFRSKEKKLYALSDYIGCMSEANVKYVLANNPEIDPKKVGICPNCIEVMDKSVNEETRKAIRGKYNIPVDKKVFVYGGNLGKPQGIPFIIQCLRKCQDIEEAFFFIVGDGTEYHLISEYIEREKPKNVKLMNRLPKEDYDAMVGACDVGLIFLDHRFTIPNFPSRLLTYMQAKLPVLACTDPNTDIGKVIVDGGFGWWCESDSGDDFEKAVWAAMNADLEAMGENAFKYLYDNWNVEKQYADIVKTIR